MTVSGGFDRKRLSWKGTMRPPERVHVVKVCKTGRNSLKVMELTMLI